MRWYIGLQSYTRKYKAFQSAVEPTPETHGEVYCAVIGPFNTKRAALWTEEFGEGNPHFKCVADAEVLSRDYLYIKNTVLDDPAPEPKLHIRGLD